MKSKISTQKFKSFPVYLEKTFKRVWQVVSDCCLIVSLALNPVISCTEKKKDKFNQISKRNCKDIPDDVVNIPEVLLTSYSRILRNVNFSLMVHVN